MFALTGLFFAALLAASPIPFQSEVVFLALQTAGWPANVLVGVASVGNVLGSCVTYALGRWLGDQRNHRWFPLTAPQMAQAERWHARWGVWSLLLSWLPGGDLIVALSGTLRTPFALFLTLVTLAKTTRYITLAWLGTATLGG